MQNEVASNEISLVSRTMSKILAVLTNMFSLNYMTELGFQVFNIQRILYYIGLMTISIYLPNMIQLQPDSDIDSTMIRYVIYDKYLVSMYYILTSTDIFILLIQCC